VRRNVLHKIKGRIRGIRDGSTQAFKRILHWLRIVPPPLRLLMDVTDVCNLQCPTCSKWKGTDPAEGLDSAQWKNAIDRLAGVSLFRDITISGGEPLLAPGIFEILNHLKRARFRVTLISNGWLVSPEVLEKLEEAGLDSLMVSLNSLREDVHDKSRGKAGSYGRIMDLIKQWKEGSGRIRLTLSTVVMSVNLDELAGMAEFAAENGLNGIIYQVLLPHEVHYSFSAEGDMPDIKPSWFNTNPLWISDTAKLHDQIEKLLVLQRQGFPILNPASHLRRMTSYFEKPEEVSSTPCMGTSQRIYIDPAGDIRLCYGYPAIGNILTDDPGSLWRSPAARRIRREARTCGRHCRMLNCNL